MVLPRPQGGGGNSNERNGVRGHQISRATGKRNGVIGWIGIFAQSNQGIIQASSIVPLSIEGLIYHFFYVLTEWPGSLRLYKLASASQGSPLSLITGRAD